MLPVAPSHGGARIETTTMLCGMRSQRAPFHRTVLSAVWDHVFDQTKDTIHPREAGGPLFMDASKPAVLPRKVEEQTNNHLVRHRLLKAIGKPLPAPDSGRLLIVCRKRREGPATKPGQLLRETKTWWWQYDEVPASKLIGPTPAEGTPGKLRHLKAAKIIGDNYGVALTPHAPQVLPSNAG